MDGFKSLPKMQCFKEGGSVNCKPVAKCSGGKMKEGGKADKAQDKSMVKKGVKQHEAALHKGQPKTELKLKTGGRAKKATGTVKKFEKASGEYGAKKTAADKKNIEEAKAFKPVFKKGGKVKKCNEGGSLKTTDAEENPGLAKLPTNVRNKMGYAKKGGKVKKMQAGGSMDVKDPQALTDKIALEENTADANIIPNALKAVKRVGKKVIKSAKDMLGGQGAVSDAEQSNIAKKKGGKVKKYADGGAVFSDEEKEYLGGADSTDPYILARMRSALGPKKPAMAAPAPSAQPMMDKPYQAPNVEQDSGLAYPQENQLRTAPMAPRPVRRPVRRPMVKPETSADLDPYGMTRKETSADLDPYGAANKPATPYINIPPNTVGMKQYGSGESPLGGMLNRFFNASPSSQAEQFRRSAEQRKKVGKNIGNTLGINKPSES